MKEENMKFYGRVTSVLRGTMFKVKIDDIDKEVLCSLSGKLRINKINIVEDDHVELKISPYDLDRGIITFRLKD